MAQPYLSPTAAASPGGPAYYYSSQCRPRELARRSVSIFSRRGPEAPEVNPAHIIPTATTAQPTNLKPMTSKQRKWIKRKSLPISASTPRSPVLHRTGTVLNLVPQAKTITMTALEEEMATSPNEEILSAISGTPRTEARFDWPVIPSEEEMNVLWRRDSVPLALRTLSKRKTERRDSMIGVWRDGIAHWDEGFDPPRITPEKTDVDDIAIFRPSRTAVSEFLRAEKPILTVVIPTSDLLISDFAPSIIAHPKPQRPVKPLLPLSTPDAFLVPTIARPRPKRPNRPRIPISRSESFRSVASTTSQDECLAEVVSPLDSLPPRSAASLRCTLLPRALNVPLADDVPLNTLKRSRRSDDSVWSNLSIPRDDESERSARSSATSFEVLIASSPVEEACPKSPDCSSAFTPMTEEPPVVVVDTDEIPVSMHIPPLPTRAPPPPPSVSVSDSIGRTLSRRSVRDGLYTLDAEEQAAKSLTSAKSEGQPHATESAEPIRTQSVVSPSPGQPHRTSSIRSVMQPPERTPTIPRRSRRRDWHRAQKTEQAVQQLPMRSAKRCKSETQIRPLVIRKTSPPAPARALSTKANAAHSLHTPTRSSSTFRQSHIVVEDGLAAVHAPEIGENRRKREAPLPQTAAEDVLFRILASLDNLQDLHVAARVNKGMYRVYEDNEMELLRAVVYNESPAAWELMGLSMQQTTRGPSDPTPSRAKLYMQVYLDNKRAIESLKCLILSRCQTTIRAETASALASSTHPSAQRFNKAFNRIWSFCFLFGYGKNREDDITGQLDWLKGGLLAHSDELSANANASLDYDMGSILLNPPECFGKGNAGGLAARELDDITELWDCMGTVLERYLGHAKQAHKNAIIENCGLGDGTGEVEQELLEDWIAYILTLGPKVVLEMAELADSDTSAGFTLAEVNGWTAGYQRENRRTRTRFLKEPISRLHEMLVAGSSPRLQHKVRAEREELSPRHVATLATETGLSRESSVLKQVPDTDSSPPTRPAPVPDLAMLTHGSGTRRSRRPSLWSQRKISPIIEDRVETFNRLSLQNYGCGLAEDTSERAIKKIVDMGFSSSQARWALRLTDCGGGLRVDRAVEVLLRTCTEQQRNEAHWSC